MKRAHWVPGNTVSLLINGEGYYPRVFDAIARARKEVLLETFILFDDKVGRQLQQALIAAAQSLGSTMPDPFMAMSFMGLEVIPSLKLTDLGLVDVEAFQLVDLFVEDGAHD